MSGPKLSQAEIERLRQEQLERERLEALKKLQQAQNVYRSACDRAKSLQIQVARWLDNKDTTSLADYGYSDIRSIINSIDIIKVREYKTPESFYDAAGRINKTVEETAAKLKAILAVVTVREKNDQKMRDINKTNQTIQSIISDSDNTIETVSIDFNCEYSQVALRKQLYELGIHYRNLITTVNDSDITGFSEKACRYINGLLSDSSLLSDIDSVRRNIQILINDEQELIRMWEEKKSLYSEYYALTSVTDRQPRPLNDFRNSAAIKEEIVRLRQVYRKQDEMDYIANQINDAMVALGYTFVTSRVLTKQDNSETEFSLYQADDRTGISVYTDQTGAVMMRVTVLGDDPVISDEDKEFSYQRQIDFCAGHPDIVAALAERGVLLKQKNYCEPSKDHTYKISINNTDTTADAASQVKTQKIDRRKRRRANNKKVRTL